MSLGLAFSLFAKDRVRASGAFAQPAFLIVLAFVLVIVAPLALYIYLAHPAWAWMYLVDPTDVPGVAILPLTVGHGVAVIVGWWIGARLCAADREKQALYSAVGGGAIVLLATPLLWGRLGRYGSYADFADDRALSIMDVKLGYVLVAVVLAVVAAAGYTAYELAIDGRRVRAR